MCQFIFCRMKTTYILYNINIVITFVKKNKMTFDKEGLNDYINHEQGN